MFEDLCSRYRLAGMTKEQVYNLLGDPEGVDTQDRRITGKVWLQSKQPGKCEAFYLMESGRSFDNDCLVLTLQNDGVVKYRVRYDRNYFPPDDP